MITSLVVSTVLLTHGCATAPSVTSGGATTDQARFVGTWDLVSMHAHSSTGAVTEPWGRRPAGRLIYTADGRMVGLMMHELRNQASAATVPDEAERAVLGYFGDYTVDPARKVVTHIVVGTMRSSESGRLERFYAFRGDDLELSATVIRNGAPVRYVLVWRRAAQPTGI